MAKVTVAKSAGFCFGVKRAVQMVNDEADRHCAKVYTMGPIIHNEQVVNELAGKGVGIVNDDLVDVATGKRPPAGSVVIVRSHGITGELYRTLEESGYTIVDATCPFVKKIHKIVAEGTANGEQVIIVGNPDHPEVIGIRGWADGDCYIIEDPEQAKTLDLDKTRPVRIVSQTTFNSHKFEDIVEIITILGYDVEVNNTICNATRERQTEALDLAKVSDSMIVIGGKHSSNTQKLYEICVGQCKNTYYIQTLDDLVTVNFQSDSCVGITAGASTPNNIIQEVSKHVRGTEF